MPKWSCGFEAGNAAFYEARGMIFSGTGQGVFSDPGFVHKDAEELGGRWAYRVDDGMKSPQFPDTDNRWFHAWVKRTNPASGNDFGINFNRAGVANFAVRVSGPSPATIELRRGNIGGTLVATSVGTLDLSVGHWIEVEMLSANAGGVCNVYVDGGVSPFVTFSGDTQNSALADWDRIEISGANAQVYWDDFIITNAAEGRLGEQYGFGFQPSTSFSEGLTPSTGTNNAALVRLPPSTTEYNSALSTVEDLYNLSFPAWASSVAFVAVYAQTAQTGTQFTAELSVKPHGAATDYSSSLSITPDYGVVQSHWAVNPDSAVAWTESDIRNFAAGIRFS